MKKLLGSNCQSRKAILFDRLESFLIPGGVAVNWINDTVAPRIYLNSGTDFTRTYHCPNLWGINSWCPTLCGSRPCDDTAILLGLPVIWVTYVHFSFVLIYSEPKEYHNHIVILVRRVILEDTQKGQFFIPDVTILFWN